MTWPIFKDNQAIKSGLQPEQGATLKIYNWVAYINPQCLKDFAKKYNCKVTGHHVQHHERGDVEAALGAGELRRLLPDRGP